MGLRLIARVYDRSQALVMSSALDASGIPNFVHGFEQNCLLPLHEIGFCGFRIMVCDQDFYPALNVLEEARDKPLLEGERLSTRHLTMISLVLSLAPWFFDDLIVPLKLHRWHDLDDRRD